VEAMYKQFNMQIKGLLRELVALYPDTPIFKLMIVVYKVVKTTSVKLPQRYFHESIAKDFEEALLAHDHTPFFSDTYMPVPLYAPFVNPLKQAWLSTNEENRIVIWKYIDVLHALSRACEALKLEETVP
jgi:hypothetical protein